MNRVGWVLSAVGAAVVVCGVAPFAVTFPQRSSFLAAQEPKACGLVARSSPFGAISSCIDLGRRTPPLPAPGHVFLLLETTGGTAVVRVDYTGTDEQTYTATAVEVQPWESPGISHETSERMKTGIDGRGGLKAQPWQVFPYTG